MRFAVLGRINLSAWFRYHRKKMRMIKKSIVFLSCTTKSLIGVVVLPGRFQSANATRNKGRPAPGFTRSQRVISENFASLSVARISVAGFHYRRLCRIVIGCRDRTTKAENVHQTLGLYVRTSCSRQRETSTQLTELFLSRRTKFAPHTFTALAQPQPQIRLPRQTLYRSRCSRSRTSSGKYFIGTEP